MPLHQKPYDLSILIPARNEMFLSKTVDDILSNIEGRTEIIIVLDGEWADPGVVDDPRVTIIYHPESIGQRAATNEAARLSTAKYVMKCDAHCAFDKGFDVKMMSKMEDDVTMVPVMRNLHVFNWVCPDGHKRYQGPSGPCTQCGKPTERDIVWNPKQSPQSTSFCFDSTPHFQYFNDYKKKQVGDVVETMSIQGSCFMLTRDKYWELNICDEDFGSWGSQGIEVACKTWLSGGRVLANKNTWYAHMFRTQGADFGFPYEQKQSKVELAKDRARELFLNNKWDKAKYPLSWLVEKFWPIIGTSRDGKVKEFWSQQDLNNLKERERVSNEVVDTRPKNGIIFYTDNQLNLKIAHAVQKQLISIGLPIVSASLKPMPHFGTNIHVKEQRSISTMYKQILSALRASDADIIFFCEHDVLYHPSHFDFTPTDRNTFYYNTNVWKVRHADGHSLWVDNCIQVSGLCGFRDELIRHYEERVKLAENNTWDRNWGYEPGTPGKDIFKEQFKQEVWHSPYPNLDIRHDHNLTLNRWSKDLFRDKNNCLGWTEKHVSEIPGWSGLKI